MHIRKKGVRKTEEVFDVNGKRIEVAEEFTYLGCVVPEQMGGKRMVEVKALDFPGSREVAPPSVPTI